MPHKAGDPCPIPDAQRGTFGLRLVSGEELHPTICDALEYDEDFQSVEPRDGITHYRLRKPATPSDTHLLRDALEALKPFAEYMATAGFDRNHKGELLPDDAGLGWVYLNVGQFRAAAAILERARKAGVL